jgi:hypothetical protein
MCVDCAVVIFIQKLANMHVDGTFQNLPECLRIPCVQKQFTAVMRAGNAEANPDEINWEKVIEKWNIGTKPKGGLF